VSRQLKEGNTVSNGEKGVYPETRHDQEEAVGNTVVMDRIVSQSVNLAFEEIFAPDFRKATSAFDEGKASTWQ